MTAFEDFLDDPEAERCWLLELEAYKLSPPGLTTLYYSDRGFTSKSTDTPANTWYEGRLMPGFRVERRIVGKDGIGGMTRVFAEGSLVNVDGGLDSLSTTYSLPGRAARLYVGKPTDARADFGLVASGVTDRVWTELDHVRISFSDGLVKIDRMVNLTTYTGAGGLEGGADLKDKYKPKAYGKPHNVTPPLVDSAKLIYQVNDGAINDVTAVYDRGIALARGPDYSSSSNMNSTAPAAGTYSVWKGGGFFRVGATPAGTLTADVEGDAANSTYVTKAGEIARRILETQAGLTASEMNAASFNVLDVDTSAAVGIWIGVEGKTIYDAVGEVLESVGAFGGFSRAGQFTVARVAVAYGASAATFTDESIFEIERMPLPPVVDPIVWRARVGWQRNYTIQNDFAAAVSSERRTFAAEPTRFAKSENTSLQTAHILAKEYEVEALYRDQTDASSESARLLAIWSGNESMFRASVSPIAFTLDLGNVVTLDHPRLGLSAGVTCLILGHSIEGPAVEITVLTGDALAPFGGDRLLEDGFVRLLEDANARLLA